jgi:hypothetical protein
MSEQNLARRLADPEGHNEKRRAYHKENLEYSLLQGARYRAGKAGGPCTIEQADIKVPDRCPALGIPLMKGASVVGPNSPTLDRIIPELGYVPGNVIVVSHLANRIKSNATPAQLMAVAGFFTDLAKRKGLLSN